MTTLKSDSTLSVTDWQNCCFLMTTVFIGKAVKMYRLTLWPSAASHCNYTIELIRILTAYVY